jgi:uncharacterized membrane protein
MTSLHLVSGLPAWLQAVAMTVLFLHIAAGTIALLTGAVAITARKGERVHRVAGTLFFISMLFMGAAASFLAALEHRYSMVLGGLLTIYLVSTAWMAARRADHEIGAFERGGLAAITLLAALYLALGLLAARSGSGSIDGLPAAASFFVGTLAALMAIADLRVIIRGGLSGAQRIARHLWRMSLGLFFAAGSFFTNALPRVLPHSFAHSPMIFLPMFVPLLLMMFWLIRVRLTKWYVQTPLSQPVN